MHLAGQAGAQNGNAMGKIVGCHADTGAVRPQDWHPPGAGRGTPVRAFRAGKKGAFGCSSR